MERQSFEKHETSKSETGPKVDLESILEKGEIVEQYELSGYRQTKVVKIKDDGKGLFRPDNPQAEISGGYTDYFRTDFELLAFAVDRILQFNLVPAVAAREVDGEKGSLQQYLDSEKTVEALRHKWQEIIPDNEITKAAIFDYLINAQDRHGSNFLFEPASGKIWLIDGDYIMFGARGVRGYTSHILKFVLEKGPIVLDEEIIGAIGRLSLEVEFLIEAVADSEIKQIMTAIKNRADLLLQEKQITRQMT